MNPTGEQLKRACQWWKDLNGEEKYRAFMDSNVYPGMFPLKWWGQKEPKVEKEVD